MRLVALVVLGVAAATAWAFRLEAAGTWQFWVGVGVPYAVLGGVALYKMWDDGTLLDLLRPRWGDLSIGFLTAALLIGGSFVARSWLAPAGTPRHLWFLRIYAQLGDPEAIQRSAMLTILLLAISALEEIVWRGLVLGILEERLGSRRAWPLAALLYGLAATPSLFVLGVPGARVNPLLVTAALGCGLVWSFTRQLTKRLPPVIFSHIAFSYFVIVQFRWPGM
jgi:hypothetical protein